MTPLRQRMIQELQLHRKSPSTIRVYLTAVSQLAKHYGRCPEELAEAEIREFFRYLIVDRNLSFSSVNVKLSGIQFLYQTVLGRSKFNIRIPRKRSKHLPEVLSREQVQQLFEVTTNRKHRVMLMTTYAAGLRVSEVVQLKVTDIHSSRMMIYVRKAKKHKDRYTLLSPRLLEELRDYWQWYRPQEYLFVNRSDQPLSSATLQNVFQRAKEKAGIVQGKGIHCLRHSFATHLMESGVDATVIAKLLGHHHLATTSIYLHVTRKHMRGIRSPLDLLPDPSRGSDS